MEDPPTFQEVANSIHTLARDTKLGKNGIYFKKSKQLHNAMYQLIKSIWKEEKLPQLWWKTAVVHQLQKRRKKHLCTNFISLLNFSYKILANILLSRITPFVDKNIRSTTALEQIFMLRLILERCWEYNIELYQAYIVFDKTYQTINQEFIQSVLLHFEFPSKIVNLIVLTVRKIHYTLNINGELTITFLKYQGLRERDVLSPILFDIVKEYAIRQLNIQSKNIFLNDIQILGDDNEIVVVSQSINKVIKTTSDFNNNLKGVGLKINEYKSKFLVTSRNADEQRANIGKYVIIDSLKIEVVRHVKFLGTLFTDSNDLLNEVQCRITNASELFQSIRNTALTPRELLGIYKQVVRPIAIYGSQAWTLSDRCIHLLKDFEEEMFRNMFGTTNKTNHLCLNCKNEIKELVNESDIVLVVRRRRLQWLGHVTRSANNMCKNLLSMPKIPRKKRFQGRPRRRWRDCVFRDVCAMNNPNWKQCIINKDKWKRIIMESFSII